MNWKVAAGVLIPVLSITAVVLAKEGEGEQKPRRAPNQVADTSFHATTSQMTSKSDMIPTPPAEEDDARTRRAIAEGTSRNSESGEEPRRTVTTPGGAIISVPPKPREREVAPGTGCQGEVPPAPGLEAKLLGPRSVEVSYRFAALPPECLPTRVLLGVHNLKRAAGAWTQWERVTDLEGRVVIEVPDFYGTPDTASASAFTRDGLRSETANVQIR